MSPISYMRRIVNRAITRGPIDTIVYSYSVVENEAANRYLDLRFGRKRSTSRHTESEKIPGVHWIQHTDWKFLRNAFKTQAIKPTDVLVDVGCGDGRVISYWLSQGHKNKIVGIEIDPSTAADTARRFARFKNVEIISGDAAEHVRATGGTLFYLFNPFLGEPLRRFAESIKEMRDVRIVFYSYNDLTPFDGWHVEKFLEPGQDPAYRFAIITKA